MRYMYLVPVTFAVAVAACADGLTSPDESAFHFMRGTGKLSLTATQSARAVWEEQKEYDWTAQRYPSEIHVGHDMRLLPERDRVEILPGQTVWVSFQVDAQRRLASVRTVEGVRGTTCLTNTGKAAARGFVIVEQVMAVVGGNATAVPGATAVIPVDEKLAVGAERCFDYQIEFDAEPGASYRVVAVAAANPGAHAAVQAVADFSAEEELSFVEIDAEAWMRDGAYAGCAKTLGPDFSCTSITSIPRDQRIAPPTATGHLGMSFMVDIRNEGVCGQTFVYKIDEPLREGGPNPPGGEIREVVGSLVITTGDCPPPGGGVCPLSAAQWQELYGDGSNAAVAAEFYGMFLGNALAEKSLIMNGPEVVRHVFGRAGVTNPIGELYAQLYAAKLNIARGVDPRPVRDARIAADAFLASHTAENWDSLTENQRRAVVSWVETLKKFNESRRCGDDDDDDDDSDSDSEDDDDSDSDSDSDSEDDDGDDDDGAENRCTRTIGYWKNHAGFGPQSDVVTRLLPIWLGTAAGAKSVLVNSASQAVALLNKSGDASNGINKLYAQLLAARLNIKNGADGSVVMQTITQADVFLASHAAGDWSNLSAADRHRVLTWAAILDDYNNGRLGPGHCD